MTPPSTDAVVIELQTRKPYETSMIILKGDGTAELWHSNRVVGRQKVEVKAVVELLEQMLGLNFFELSDVNDRGTIRHEEAYQLTLRYLGRNHSVGFDDNRFASDLQNLAGKVRAIAHRDFWEPKLAAPSSQ